MSTPIKPREDVDPAEGKNKYGDVKFADEVNNKYPIDTPDHIRAAWSYIHHADNAAKYTRAELDTIRSRIKNAADKHGVEIKDQGDSK